VSDAVAVDVVVEGPIFVDVLASTTVEAIDVTMPEAASIFVDAIVTGAIEAVDVTAPSIGPIVVDIGDIAIGGGGGGGPTGMNGANGSVTPISPGTLAYVGIGWSVVENKAEFLMMIAGTVTDFGVTIGISSDLGSAVLVSTLRKNGVDTSLSVSLTGTARSGFVAGTVAFAKGDRASIKANVPAGAPGNVIVTPTWRLVPT
jgi:hypothetical protein